MTEEQDHSTSRGTFDMVRRGGVVLLGEAASRLIAFAGIPFAALFLSDTELGALAVAMLVFSLLIILFDFGVPGAATKLHFDDVGTHGQGGLWWLMLSIVAGGLVLALSIGPALLDLAFSNVTFYPLIFAVVIAAAGGAFTAFGQARYRATFQFERFAALSVARSILLVGPGVVGAALTGTAVGYVYGIAFGQLALGLLTIAVFRHEIGRPTSASWRPGLLFGLPLVPHLLFGWWLNLADRVLLERWWGLAEVGVYALSYQLSFASAAVMMALNNMWAPQVYRWFSREGSAEGDSLVARVVMPAMAAFILVAAATVTIAPWLYALIRPESTAPAHIFTIVPLASLFFGIYLLGVSPVFARGETKVVPLVTGFGVVVNLVGNILLIPQHAGTGAATATLLGFGATAVAVTVVGNTIGFSRFLVRRLSAALLTLALLGIAAVVLPESMEVAAFWIAGLLAGATATLLLRSDTARASGTS